MSEQIYRRHNVGIIGSSSVSDEVAAEAKEIGKLLCRMGVNLVCGGMGGVMEEACGGFAEQRLELEGKGCGVTIGILPGASSSDANPFVDIAIPTSMGIMRNFLVVQSADLVIAIAGGSGTLSEMSIAWQHGKSIIAMGETGGWAGELAGKRIDSRRPDTVKKAASVEDVEKSIKSILFGGKKEEDKTDGTDG